MPRLDDEDAGWAFKHDARRWSPTHCPALLCRQTGSPQQPPRRVSQFPSASSASPQVLHPGVLAANPSIEALHLRGNPSLGPSLAADGILGVALAAAAKARSAGPAGAEGEGESGPRGLRYCEASGAVLAGPPGTRGGWGVSDLEALVRHKAAGLRELESQVR